MHLLYVLVGLALIAASVLLLPTLGPVAYLFSFAGGWVCYEGLKNL